MPTHRTLGLFDQDTRHRKLERLGDPLVLLVIASGMVAVVGLDAAAALHSTEAAQAASLWTAISVIQAGLGGGVEIVGGLWLLLISIAASRSQGLPTLLCYTGLAVGAAGVITIVPGLGDLGAVFGLGQILWFVWIGVVLLRRARLKERSRAAE